MKDLGTKPINMVKITKVILDVMFYSGILVFLTLPFSLKWAGRYYADSIAEHYISMLLIFGAAAVMGLFIVGELRSMMRTVWSRECFVWRNVQSLERMGGVSAGISVLFLIKLFIVPTPATLIIILVFFVAALFSGVLSQVFAEAIRYKEETDLTI